MLDLKVLDTHVAGIDVGSERMHLSVAGARPEVFGSTTSELKKLCARLVEHKVRSVAMEATGVYWMCLYDVLETAGIEVIVVNGRQSKHVPGRKTDMSDCQWLTTMHSHGLLHGGFVPDASTRQLQDYVRLRQDHVAQAASCVLLMQKACERMNVKIHDVIRSLTGVSGLKMVRAIIAGERDASRLIALCDVQIRNKKAASLKEALTGTWKEEHIFALRQALNTWEFYQSQISECDKAIEAVLKSFPVPDGSKELSGEDAGAAKQGVCRETEDLTSLPTPLTDRFKGRKKSSPGPNTPQIEDLHDLLVMMCGGKDATTIPGIGENTLLQLISEVGVDLSKWPTAKHYVSWLGLAPGSHQSGKRNRSTKRCPNRAGRLFCMIAMGVGRSVDTAFGGFYRRIKSRRGAQVANKALARKIATMFWQLMVYGKAYVEDGLESYQVKAAASQLQVLQHMASRQGYYLVQKDGVVV